MAQAMHTEQSVNVAHDDMLNAFSEQAARQVIELWSSFSDEQLSDADQAKLVDNIWEVVAFKQFRR